VDDIGLGEAGTEVEALLIELHAAFVPGSGSSPCSFLCRRLGIRSMVDSGIHP
jgi:hypothetical protein